MMLGQSCPKGNPHKGMTRSERKKEEVEEFKEEDTTLTPQSPPSLLRDDGATGSGKMCSQSPSLTHAEERLRAAGLRKNSTWYHQTSCGYSYEYETDTSNIKLAARFTKKSIRKICLEVVSSTGDTEDLPGLPFVSPRSKASD